MAQRRAPAGRKKIISLHLDGATLDVGLANFIGQVLDAVASRSQSNLDSVNPGDPKIYTNANGDMVIYVSPYSL